MKPGCYPGVVVVHGSGPQGISHNYYNFWGRFFASPGVAALIYDKRGVGRSTAIASRPILRILQDELGAVKLLGPRKAVRD